MQFKTVIVNGKQRIIITKVSTGNDKTNEAVDYIMKGYEHKTSPKNKIIS